ncbi:hypothetical protein [Bacteroides pyogenes]|nr:hypothetical protein [Bacteroides pyogenes]MBR8726195.1 hypothetical protein [Bacteroides pyogenes]MBR8739574.1 hypothetical protein [Bacteroides pyogenes]MBR8755384.1 hypothetical protein [Bacteroides pyogenes]MBR8796688.1 hypothetical protein [Bacteroides pyogenes]MBR8810261.1 hypothetical protein [Bacteroides pyogenes]
MARRVAKKPGWCKPKRQNENGKGVKRYIRKGVCGQLPQFG